MHKLELPNPKLVSISTVCLICALIVLVKLQLVRLDLLQKVYLHILHMQVLYVSIIIIVQICTKHKGEFILKSKLSTYIVSS